MLKISGTRGCCQPEPLQLCIRTSIPGGAHRPCRPRSRAQIRSRQPDPEEIRPPGGVDIGRRDRNRQNKAERAGQDMALDALDFLVAVEPTLTLLRAGDDAFKCGPVVGSAERPWASRTRRVSWAAAFRPHAVGPEPVIPTAYRLMRTEVESERSPGQPVCSRSKQPFTTSRISAVKVK